MLLRLLSARPVTSAPSLRLRAARGLSHFAEARLSRGCTASLRELLPELLEPPVADIGALPVDVFLSARQRGELAADLNTLIASPDFSARSGRD